MDSTSFIIIIAVICWNTLSAYFWIWLYKELFHKQVSLLDVVKQWAISAFGALWIIKISWLSQIFTKVLIEEWTKTGASELTSSHELPSDHIGTAILSWVAFAIVENIVYLSYLHSNDILQVSIIRIMTNSILHWLFTWNIGYGIYLLIMQKEIHLKILYGLSFICIGLLSHLLYNRSIQQSYIAFAFLFVILWYLWLSFLLYKSDRLYL